MARWASGVSLRVAPEAPLAAITDIRKAKRSEAILGATHPYILPTIEEIRAEIDLDVWESLVKEFKGTGGTGLSAEPWSTPLRPTAGACLQPCGTTLAGGRMGWLCWTCSIPLQRAQSFASVASRLGRRIAGPPVGREDRLRASGRFGPL